MSAREQRLPHGMDPPDRPRQVTGAANNSRSAWRFARRRRNYSLRKDLRICSDSGGDRPAQRRLLTERSRRRAPQRSNLSTNGPHGLSPLRCGLPSIPLGVIVSRFEVTLTCP